MNKKRFVMVAIILVVVAAIAFAVPMQMGARGAAVQSRPMQGMAAQARPAQMGAANQMAVQQRQMLQDCILEDGEIPEEMQALIDARRAEAAARQTANRANQTGNQMRQGARGQGGRW
ncbi:hypothetical protein [Sphaerochaeta globosa]|uniref:Uncharacterized protein n=1 Tax=Sphaerochaeta globosa (strain ATCC BAA-1886 / DSM 22777 / Buddy) TaxID=158189 RepID=F0RW68_SPHGB|nr:hypothetical protein [Sphaerochaeta globosa]ADY13425.1 hypothetical protein SpiBuddy_1600 [Sphaerochaeta globosa str. Buddy]